MRRLIVAVAAFLALGSATPAFAETKTHEIAVMHADLALDREAGAVVMLRRIERAAERACGLDRSQRRLAERAAARACVANATHDAVVRLNAPVVAQLYRRGDAALVVAAR